MFEQPILLDTIILVTGIPAFVLLFFRKKAFQEPIVPFVVLTALASLYEVIGTGIFKINATYWFQVYSAFSFGALFYFYFKLFSQHYKILFALFFIGFIGVFGMSVYVFDSQNLISTAINETFITTFVIVCTVLWFKQLFDKTTLPDLLEDANFYFVMGILLYHSMATFCFLLGDFLFHNDKKVYFYSWLLNLGATIVLRSLLIIGVWKMKRA